MFEAKRVREQSSLGTARLLERPRRVEVLPPADRRAILKLVGGMLELCLSASARDRWLGA
jgi:hypothetical protein